MATPFIINIFQKHSSRLIYYLTFTLLLEFISFFIHAEILALEPLKKQQQIPKNKTG
jgi:hypothetical protein